MSWLFWLGLAVAIGILTAVTGIKAGNEARGTHEDDGDGARDPGDPGRRLSFPGLSGLRRGLVCCAKNP